MLGLRNLTLNKSRQSGEHHFPSVSPCRKNPRSLKVSEVLIFRVLRDTVTPEPETLRDLFPELPSSSAKFFFLILKVYIDQQKKRSDTWAKNRHGTERNAQETQLGARNHNDRLKATRKPFLSLHPQRARRRKPLLRVLGRPLPNCSRTHTHL